MRKIYTQADRANVLAAAKRGESVPEIAKRVGVTLATAYRWLREEDGGARALVKQPAFVELVTSVAQAGLVVRVGSAEVDVRTGFDPTLLRAIVLALGGAA